MTSMTDTAIQQFFDGRSFGEQTPAAADNTYRVAATAAIRHRFEQYENDRGLAASELWVDDRTVGDRLYTDIETAYRDRYGVLGVGTSDTRRIDVGRWIKALITTHLEAGMTATPITYDDIEWPEDAPGMPREAYRASVLRWVNDDINDVAPTLDLMMARTNITFIENARTYFTTGSGKDFLSYLMLRKTQLLFPHGQKVTLQQNDDYPLSEISVPSRHVGEQNVVDRVERMDGAPTVVLQAPSWYVRPCHLIRTTDEAVHSVNTDDEVAALKAQVERLTNDIETIGRRFWNEAKDRGWCSEAEQVIADLNSEISVPLPESRPIGKWNVTIRSSDFGCGYIVLSEVEASSEDEAKEKVKDALDSMRWAVDFRERFREAADEVGLEFESSDEGLVSFAYPSYELEARAGE